MTLRTVLWRSTWIGVAFVVIGLTIAIVDAAIYGSLYAAREPWIGAALAMIAIGLVVAGVAGTAFVLVAGRWWAKLLVVVPAAIATLWWITMFTVGLPTTGFGGSTRDVRTIIYSVPEIALAFVGLPTLAIVFLAWVIGRRKDRAKFLAPPE